MKRNLSNLEPMHYEAMICWMEWKKDDARYMCPWDEGCSDRNKLCKDIFPRLPETIGCSAYQYQYQCPCSAYSYKYVRRVIRGILKDREDAS